MMLLVLSDLHLESAAYQVPADLAYDALILAGDILAGGRALPDAAARRFGEDRPIVIVPGNHEFYGTVMQEERQWMGAHRQRNVHDLDPGEAMLDSGPVRVLGCTLWTDFELPIRVSPPGAAPATS